MLTYSSSVLQRFPVFWKQCVWLIQLRKFRPSKVQYQKNSNSETIDFRNKEYWLIFDAQCLQTQTIQRGIGRYTLEFIEAICLEMPTRNFAAILTTIAPQKNLSKAHLALAELRCTNLDVLIIDPFKDRKKISLVQAQNRINSILKLTSYQAIIAMSAFENPINVIPVKKDSNKLHVGILYDLIPLQFPQDLLFSNFKKSIFEMSYNNLIDSDLILAISVTSQEALEKQLNHDLECVVIYGGTSLQAHEEYNQFEDRSGIMCVGAELPHKNLDRLILAYCQLPENIQLEHNLVIIGIRSIGVRLRLLRLAKKAKIKGEIILFEYLNESDLLKLYQDMRVLVMPSLAEGLSLPILEAWSQGLVVIGSTETVAEEVISSDSQLFNPFNVSQMGDSISKFLTSKVDWEKAFEDLLIRQSFFSWKKSAKTVILAIEKRIQ